MTKTNASRTVDINCWVKIAGFQSGDAEDTYYIVPDRESDVFEDKLPLGNPLAEALIGAKVGDKISYRPPGGEVELQIVDIGSLRAH